ncbi:cytochrome c biogenesis protein CcdA [Marinobacteraceae bacterium S3BR75-40.1]
MLEAPWLILTGQFLLAILAGLLLNLTPCVLPAIPIKIRTILRESGGQKSHRALAALAFLAGTLGFFLTLGTLTALLQWNWGMLFQSSIFVGVLVAILLGFALITWLDVPIPVPQFAVTAHGHRYVEALIAGLLSAILAAPCAGPFLGGVLAFAVTQPTHVILLLFGGIGLGLALPYIALLLHPQWLSRLPKAGEWTLAVREMLALVLVAAAVFFSASLVPATVYLGLWWAWLALTLCWAVARGWRGGKLTRWISAAAGVVALSTTLAFAWPHSHGNADDGIVWQPYSAEQLTQVRTNKQAHLIEFTADWCLNCKVLERTVYASPAVARAVAKERIVPIQVDMTQSHPDRDSLLGTMGGQALPFAVIVDREGEVVARFTGLFEEEALIEALHRTR